LNEKSRQLDALNDDRMRIDSELNRYRKLCDEQNVQLDNMRECSAKVEQQLQNLQMTERLLKKEKVTLKVK
jgi:hypothetical protein